MTFWTTTGIFLLGILIGVIGTFGFIIFVAFLNREDRKTQRMQAETAAKRDAQVPKAHIVEALLDIEPPGGYA